MNTLEKALQQPDLDKLRLIEVPALTRAATQFNLDLHRNKMRRIADLKPQEAASSPLVREDA
jgi:hypothetical protein